MELRRCRADLVASPVRQLAFLTRCGVGDDADGGPTLDEALLGACEALRHGLPCSAVLLLHMLPTTALALAAAQGELAADALHDLRVQLIADSAVPLAVLVLTVVLAVQKPRGLTKAGAVAAGKRASGDPAPYALPTWILAKVVGAEPLPRTEVTKRLWDYIKAHNLQNPANKRNILCDVTPKAILGKDEVTMFEMTGLVGKHLGPT